MGPAEPTIQDIALDIETTSNSRAAAIAGLSSDDDAKQKQSYTNRDYYAGIYLTKLEEIFEIMEVDGDPPPLIENRFYTGEHIGPNGFS
tara:strand:- start:23182 stop:23448 length:267 start_codon:yes stop_codon:yes gene_type:complete